MGGHEPPSFHPTMREETTHAPGMPDGLLGADCPAGPLSTLSLTGLPTSRVLASRGQPIAPTPPPSLVDRQTGAAWGLQSLRSASEGEAGEARRGEE